MEGGGGKTLSELYNNSKRLSMKTRDALEKLERLAYVPSSSNAVSLYSDDQPAAAIRKDTIQIQSFCSEMDALWRSVPSEPQRDLWKRKVERVFEEAESFRASLDNYVSLLTRNLPEDLIHTEIFSRLPTKSVGRFRCLSKTWRTRLSSPEFINLHLTHKPHQEHSILVSRDDSLHLVTYSKSLHAALSQKIPWPNICTKMMGSCNGLLLLMDREQNMYLLSPITMQHFKVPASTFAWEKEIVRHRMYGFGFDSSTDDYKIVTISSSLGSREIYVEVFSFKTCVWKRFMVDNFPYQHIHNFYSKIGHLVNGALHWWATRVQSKSRMIVAFDLANEVFYEIPAPKNAAHSSLVFVLRGCLGTMVGTGKKEFEIWMMSKYGMVDSWCKVITVPFITWMPLPSFLNCGDEFLLGSSPVRLVLCNVKQRTTRKITVDGLPEGDMFLWGYSFVDSLVSPIQLAGSSHQ